MATDEPNSLLSALEAWRGIICLAGGEDTAVLLHHLTTLHPGLVGITSTVPIPAFPNQISAYQVITEERWLPALARVATKSHRLVAYAQPSVRGGHLIGVPPALIGVTHRQGGFDVTLVKTNGTHGTHGDGFKTPKETTPTIPKGTSTIILMISTPALGRFPSKRMAHQKTTTPKDNHVFRSSYLAQLLVGPTEELKRVSKARVIPLVNIADGPTWEKQGVAAAETALRLTEHFDRVVLACMTRGNPLVRVIHRSELRP